MAAIVETVEIARSPEEVFAYMDQLERHGEWQSQIVGVGTRATDVRRTPMGKQSVTYEIVEHDPPRRASFRGVNGPVRPHGAVTVEPVGDGRSKLTLELDLEGHGLLGKLLAPLALSQSRKLVPQDQQRLKERLEAGA